MKTPPEIQKLRPFTPTNIAYNTSINPFTSPSTFKDPFQDESYKYSSNNIFVNSSKSKDNYKKSLSTYLSVLSHRTTKSNLTSKSLLSTHGLIPGNDKNNKNPKKKHKVFRELTSARINSSNNMKFGLKYLPKRKLRNININISTSPKINNKENNNNLFYHTQRPLSGKNKNNSNNEKSNERFIIEDLFKKEEVNDSVHIESEFLQFRTSYILEYSKNSEHLRKIAKYFDVIKDDKKNIAVDLYDKLLKIYDENNKVIFNKPNLNETITFDTWKNMVILFSDFTHIIINLLSIFFSEIKVSRSKILSLTKKTSEQSNFIIQQTKDFNEINTYIRKHELNNFTHNKKSQLKRDKEFQLQTSQITFTKKENAYIMTIHRLEEEIKDLIKVLNENKTSSDTVKRAQIKMEEANKQMDLMQMDYHQKINGVNIRMGIFKDEIESLKEQITKLEEKNLELLTNKEELTTTIIERTAEKNNLKNRIDEIMEENMRMKELIDKYEIKEKEGNENKQTFINRVVSLKLKDDSDSESDNEI